MWASTQVEKKILECPYSEAKKNLQKYNFSPKKLHFLQNCKI